MRDSCRRPLDPALKFGGEDHVLSDFAPVNGRPGRAQVARLDGAFDGANADAGRFGGGLRRVRQRRGLATASALLKIAGVMTDG